MIMDFNPLTEDLSHLKTITVNLEKYLSEEPDIFFDHENFLHYLTRYHHLDVITYSTTGVQSLRNVRRLIHGLPLPFGTTLPKDTKSVCLKNIHTKMYLCFESVKIKEVFVSSFNLVKPTTLNVTARVSSPAARKLCAAYFNDLWKKST